MTRLSVKMGVKCISDSLLLMNIIKLISAYKSCHYNVTKGQSFPMTTQFHNFHDFPGVRIFLNTLEKRNTAVEITLLSQNRYDSVYRERKH